MITKYLIACVVAAGLLGSATSSVQASAGAPKACVFDKHSPISADAYSGTDTTVDWGAFPTTHGVQLFVPASECLTKEWLNVSVQHALDSAHSADHATKPLCDMPRLKNVHVNVVSAGNGYWVQLLGRDEKTADALLTWARTLVAPRLQAGASAK